MYSLIQNGVTYVQHNTGASYNYTEDIESFEKDLVSPDGIKCDADEGIVKYTSCLIECMDIKYSFCDLSTCIIFTKIKNLTEHKIMVRNMIVLLVDRYGNNFNLTSRNALRSTSDFTALSIESKDIATLAASVYLPNTLYANIDIKIVFSLP